MSSNIRVLGTGKALRMYESDNSDMVSIPDDEGLDQPDVAQEEETSSFSMAIDSVQPSHYRLNIKDVTAWMLLKMAEPEESQLTEWFWWTSCVLFERLGAYKEMLDKLNLRDEPRGYVPIRLTFVKELTSEDVALHFHCCGVRVADITSYLWDFSKNYLRGRCPPAPPMWSAIPPHGLESPSRQPPKGRNAASKPSQIMVNSHLNKSHPTPSLNQSVNPQDTIKTNNVSKVLLRTQVSTSTLNPASLQLIGSPSLIL